MSWEGIRASIARPRAGVCRGAVATLALVAVLGVTACGGGGSTTGGATEAEKTSPETGEAGLAVFQQECSSCHKLAAAKATFGTYGPDLDQVKPSQAAVEKQVTNGGGIMPAFGKQGLLSKSEIEAVASYVATEAGK